MHHITTYLVFSFLPLLSLTADIPISVSNPQGAFLFDPASTTASPGDVLVFSFLAPSHSVASSSFDTPCHPSANGFFSGVIAQPSDQVFRVPVNSSDPIFFYCIVPGHCPAGMVGVVNPPSGQDINALREKARSDGSGGSGTPSAVGGGTFAAAQSGGASSGGSSVASTPANPGSTSGASTSTPANPMSTSAAGGGEYGSPTTPATATPGVAASLDIWLPGRLVATVAVAFAIGMM